MKGIDEKDEEILKALKENSRISFRELANTLKIPHTTVWSRVERLKDLGVIKKFTIEIGEKELLYSKLQRKDKEELISLLIESFRERNLERG